MKIQVNSDKSIEVDQALMQRVETTVSDVLNRFSDRLTRVEVHLSDVDGERSNGEDKRCLLEARPAGLDPVVVTNLSSTPLEAASGAADKMERLLDSRFGRLGDKK